MKTEIQVQDIVAKNDVDTLQTLSDEELNTIGFAKETLLYTAASNSSLEAAQLLADSAKLSPNN